MSRIATKGDIVRLEDRLEDKIKGMEARQDVMFQKMCDKWNDKLEQRVKLHKYKCSATGKKKLKDMKSELTAISVAVGTAVAVLLENLGLV